MTNREVSRQALAGAIAAIELQREALGEAVANTALFALRQKLALIETKPADDPQAELVVLAADLSGFTALAEQMDAERVREAINAMWQVLDGVVQSWGGQIDQHAGDGMVAIFGLPRPRPHDLQRALRTALALQVELRLFNEQARQQRQSWAAAWPGPTMRIGIHQGPVFFGKAGYGNRRTAVGETVNLAKALEQAAPVGGVLVSSAIAPEVQAGFELTIAPAPDGNDADQETRGSVQASNGSVVAGDAHHLNGKAAGVYATLVQQTQQVSREKQSDGATPPGQIAGQETRFVGRERELDFLEMALQTVLDGRFPQVVTITAAPGSGSSRLLYEFERRLKLLPERIILLRSQMNAPAQQARPTFWQELLFRYAGIRLNDSPGVMREKLAQALGNGQRSSQLAQDSYRLADSLLAIDQETAAQQSQAIESFGRFLRVISEEATVVVLLEQLHLASEQSLELLETLVEQHPDLPLLVVATSQPAIFDRRPGWQGDPFDPFAPYSHLQLQPLSAIDGRHLLAELLQRLPSPPLRLLDLIATAAQGNPLYMEETVRLLLDQGVISSDAGGRWHIDMVQMEATKLPASLNQLYAARFDQLPPAEQQLLAYAAAVGPIFWDAALWQEETADNALTPVEVDRLLPHLVQKGMISPNQMWCFGSTQAYAFNHTLFYQTAAEHLPHTRRQLLQRQTAHWLEEEWENGRMSRAFPTAALLSHYLEQAGEATRPIVQTAASPPTLAIPVPQER